MGQVHSHFKKSISFWHRRKSKAARHEPCQESLTQMSPPPPGVDRSSAQMDQSPAHPDQSSITANTTPASGPTHTDRHGDTMAEACKEAAGQASNVDKAEEQASSPHDRPTADKPDQPTPAGGEPISDRPAPKREHTPPHRIRILNQKGWQTEHIYGNVHDHITKTLNRVREQQVDFIRRSKVPRKLEGDVYKAADSCTLALEHLVGNFSTKFFHHTGPEKIVSMMAAIDADAAALDELRLKQLRMINYGFSLEKKIAQTERHIRELAELARRIREGVPCAGGDGEADADGDTDPEAEGISY